jgi:hypothetical protein
MKHDHLMGYPQAAIWSADAEPVYLQGVRIDFTPLGKRFAIGVPLRAYPPAPGKKTGPTLSSFLPAGVMQCTNADRRGISHNPDIRAVRLNNALGDFNSFLLAHRAVCHDTSDC